LNTHILAYSNQNDDTIKELSFKYPHILICLDSGSSFRKTSLYNGYIPSNNPLKLTKRPFGVEFIQFPDLEAKDIMALWLIKNKIEEPKRSNKTLLSKILLGNSFRGIPSLCSPENSKRYTEDFDPDIPLWKAYNILEDEFEIPYNKLHLNEQLFSYKLNVFRENLEGFDKFYNSLKA